MGTCYVPSQLVMQQLNITAAVVLRYFVMPSQLVIQQLNITAVVLRYFVMFLISRAVQMHMKSN